MADAVEVVSQPPPQRTEQRQDEAKRPQSLEVPLDRVYTPKSPAIDMAPRSFHRRGSFELDDYFTGPRDIAKHSKWPIILQLHGSIMPKLILPLVLISVWASAIVIISAKVHYLGANSVLLTLTGFVVSLSLSFRSSTAYERYTEGRKYWAALVQSSQILGRVFWIHAVNRPDQTDAREVILQKLSAMNLLVAYAMALKHSLRFEPYTAYPDLQNLIGHLDTFARAATDADSSVACGAGGGRKRGFFRGVGEYLGVSFAASNPRKMVKRASKPLGNLPLEILNHIALTTDFLITNEQLRVPIHQTMAFNAIQALNDAMTGSERVLCTPLPIAYSIAISQSTYLYILLLPFQLIPLLQWIAIPATIAASYIILGVLMIGQEIENPFGSDVNDLPLDSYCDQIAADLDIIAAFDTRDPQRFLKSSSYMPLYPVSAAPISVWMQRSEEKLRDAIKQRPAKTFEWRRWGTKKTAGSSSASASVAGDHMV
ncbi:bestrophin, RFP-TM, chloride channel domain-containing protein [Hirsutella rhossiliensis]|uniref:Bestrophin, RFP-TM, chloride channel domain-containing protein n=1 Tax=Hirsutella rhossiliensis TaxID=111463 RepID=A0A9P8N3S4_9HYPO|nr:bestrophin, RFP-TM, chloride channel domain-containing protein [Hirsutella rhossiliensis]KAH0966052.1 bestrophin, RFP-TM, chloride channel domain-containing protein [Hirsutella rhossiliensis]